MATEIAPEIKLPNDQQAMQDSLAESANQAQDVATNVANTAVVGREGLRIGAGILNFGSKLLRGKQLIQGGMLRSRIPYVGTALLADYAVSEYRDDGKGLFELSGESLGNYAGDKMYEERNRLLSQPITQEEIDAYRANFNVQEPVADVASPPITPRDVESPVAPITAQPLTEADKIDLREGMTLESMRNAGPQSLGEAYGLGDLQRDGASSLREAYGAPALTPDIPKRGVATPEVAPDLQFAGGGMRPDGVENYFGVDADGNRVPMTKQGVDAFAQNQPSQSSASGLMRKEFESSPVVSATPQEGLSKFTDGRGEVAYGNETAKQMFSQEAIAEANKARTAPEATETPLEATETPLEAPAEASETPTPPSSPEESPAPAGTPEDQKTSEQSEYDQEIAEQEAGLIKNAQRLGYSQADIDKMLGGVRERRAEAEDKEKLENLLTTLQIEKLMIGNALLTKELNEPIVGEPKVSELNAIRKSLTDRGITQDPNTGAFTVTEEGFFMDSESFLSPNSALFQELNGTQAGRYLLNMKPPEILAVENPETTQVYQALDGRLFGWDGEQFRVMLLGPSDLMNTSLPEEE